MATQSFKDLIVWQRASELSLDVYRSFNDIKDYSFRDQIRRAALSAPNNIAEGYARRSDKAFRNFLFIAKGSIAEVESMLLIAQKLGYVTNTQQEELINKADEVSRLLSGFIKKLSAVDS